MYLRLINNACFMIPDTIVYDTGLQPRIDDIRQMKNASSLMKLMQTYNWDDGFEIPLTVITHSSCDLGLALFLFWELDEVRSYYRGEESDNAADEYRLAFCKTLVEGLIKGKYKAGSNKYDTGFYGEHLAPEGSAVHELRALRTRRAKEHYPDPFLYPVL